MIKGCLMAYDLDTTGTHEELHARLGAHLVALKLGMNPAVNNVAKKKRPHTPPRRVAKKARPTRAQWFAFLREEKERVKTELGLVDRISVMKEISRRWSLLKKSSSASAAPLLLTYKDDSDMDNGLAQVLAELPSDEVHAALEVHGIAIDDHHGTNVSRLARALC